MADNNKNQAKRLATKKNKAQSLKLTGVCICANMCLHAFVYVCCLVKSKTLKLKTATKLFDVI